MVPDSVFGLIPDFDSCEDKYPANKDFIEAFRKGFEECINSRENKFIKTTNGIRSLEEIIFDETRITTDNIISDSDFYVYYGLVFHRELYLPDMSVRTGNNYQRFTQKYTSVRNTLEYNDLKVKPLPERWLSEVVGASRS